MGIWWQDERVTHEEILAVPCKWSSINRSYFYNKAVTPLECNAEVGSPCIHTTGELKGKPMVKSFHVTRRQDAKRRKHRLKLERERRRLKDQRDNATRSQREIAHAMQQFDIREHNNLKEWIREYGSILWQSTVHEAVHEGDEGGDA